MGDDSTAMKPASSEQSVFAGAMACASPADRIAYLEAACGPDAALRARVEALLSAAERAGDFLEQPPTGLAASVEFKSESGEKPGDIIDRYTLLEQIGEGGCGVVYMAEQREPVRRRVALKVIKLGMDTRAVIARFEAERQALALMDHMNIAKVFDGGATQAGRPYFVMELVRGVRITDFCDRARLDLTARLRLFILVCQAVQHAHQKGVIHRDLKPSNILVTVNDGTPVPKVIDFGIAKATGQRLTDKTLFTQFHSFLGTPAYTSPEQAEMSSVDIDTRSDIYSLGVLLYELLTGRTPFDSERLLSSGMDEMRRILRDEEPLTPSQQLARHQGLALGPNHLHGEMEGSVKDLSSRRRSVPSDLDWIVMKCLEKDRSRRYSSASDLASDIQRHLENEPVIARPPSTAYQFQKAVRRNKLLFSAGIVLFLTLLAAVGLVTLAWKQTQVERDKAIQAQAGEEVQRKASEANERAAKKAEAGQSLLRQQAEAQAMAARRSAYASDMNLAQQALATGNLGRLQELLDHQRPQPGLKDLRGWEWRYLWQYSNTRPAFSLPQTSNAVWTLSSSSDARWLAVGEYENGGLAVWDLAKQRVRSRIQAGNGNVHAAFSPTAPLLAYSIVEGSAEQRKWSVRLRNVTTDQEVGEFTLGGPCVGLQFSADGQILVSSTSGPENQVAVWRVSDRVKLASYSAPPGAADEAIPFAITADASLLAYGSPTLHVVELATGKERWRVRAAIDHVMSLSFSPDGTLLALGAGYSEFAIRLWNVASGKEVHQLQGHGGWVSSLGFLPDGKTLVSGSADGTLRIWDLSHPTQVPPPRVVGIHKNEIARLVVLPGSTRIVSGDIHGSLRAWDLTGQGRPSPRIKLPISLGGAWRIAPDGQSLLTVAGGRVSRWMGEDFRQEEPLMVVGDSHHRRDYLFSADTKLLAVASADHSVSIWDLARREVKYRITCSGVPSPVAFLSGDKNLVVADLDGDALHEWSLTTGRELRSWPKPIGGIHAPGEFGFSPDDRWLLCVHDEGTATLHDLVANRTIHVDVGAKHPEHMVFSLDSRFVALGGFDRGKGKLLDTGTLRPVTTLESAGHSIAFSPDGERLALGGAGKKAISICDPVSGRELLNIPGESPLVWWCEFSSDGRLLGALNEHGSLIFWRAPSWEEIAEAELEENNRAERLSR